MNTDKLLTISIAAYNAEDTLCRTLDSLRLNDELMDKLDIIIVDDGSTDGTRIMAEEYASEHADSVRVISKPNGGYGSAVNTSIDSARGLYFRLLDADDAADRAGLEGLLGYLTDITGDDENSIPDMIVSPFRIDRTGGMIPVGHERGKAEAVTGELYDRHLSLQTEPVRLEDACLEDGLMMFELTVRTDILRKSGVRLTENCFYTDNEYVMAAELYAGEAVRYALPFYIYTMGLEGQSMSIAGRRLHYEDKMRSARGVFRIYEDFRRSGCPLADKDRRPRDDETHCMESGLSSTMQISGTRKLVTDKLLSTMVREVYVSMMIQEEPQRFRDELKRFDRELESDWPYEYARSCDSVLVRTARRTWDIAYPGLCRHVLRRETMRMGSASSGSDDSKTTGRGIRKTSDVLLTAAEYTAAACMIVQCRTVYMHLKGTGMIVNRTAWVVMVAALAACILLGRRNCLPGTPGDGLQGFTDGSGLMKRRKLLTCIAITVYAALFIAINPVNHLRVIRCAGAVIMLALLALNGEENPGPAVMIPAGSSSAVNSHTDTAGCIGKNDIEKFGYIRILVCYRDLMVIIAAVSLLGWITGSILKVLPCTGFAWMDWSATGEYVRIPTFLGIYFETQWTGWELVQARNSGIFTEAPMAGCAYSIALMAECLIVRTYGKRKHRLRIALLTSAIISTMSLISYGFLLLLAAGVLFSGRGKGISTTDCRGRLAAVGAIAAGAALLAVLIVHKLSIPTGGVRLNDFKVGFDAWLAHPFFGGGFEDLGYLQKFMPEWRSFDIGFSNSPMEILAQGGIYLALPYTYAFVSALREGFSRGNGRLCAVTILFAYIFTFTVIPYQYITFYMLILLVYASRQHGVRDDCQ